ncbi:MAG: PHP domain-containing protein [Jiangellaceae bacterium]
MRIDLHVHSNFSDGTDRPGELPHRAREAGVDVLALTDHDTVDGWPAALASAADTDVVVVPGVEISTRLRGAAVHLLGYLPDPSYAPLASELARVRESRVRRLSDMTALLTRAGVPIDVADVLAVAGSATTLGRPHIADALIAKGYVRDRSEAFTRWLSEGGPAYVPKYAPATSDAIRLVREAGGVAVLAHPWGRGSRRMIDDRAIERLARLGLGGLEVDHEDHAAADRATLREIAGELDLVVTGSSDHHGTGKSGHALGVNTTAVDQYERLLDLARTAASAAGREPPPLGVP